MSDWANPGAAIVVFAIGVVSLAILLAMKLILKRKIDKDLEERVEVFVFFVFVAALIVLVIFSGG